MKEIIPTRHTRSSALRLGLLDHGTKKATGTGNNGKGKKKGNKKGKKVGLLLGDKRKFFEEPVETYH